MTHTEKQSLPLETWYKLCPDDLQYEIQSERSRRQYRANIQANDSDIDNQLNAL